MTSVDTDILSALAAKGIDPRVLQASAVSTPHFGKLFFPDRYTRPFAPQAHALFEIMDRPAKPIGCAICHRGFGKTTNSSITLPARHIVWGTKRCYVHVSNSATKAIRETENLKYALLNSELAKYIVGEIKGEEWSKDGYVVNKTMVLPRGAMQQVRGYNYLGHRPDLIVIDDLEDNEGVRSEERRDRLLEWFMSDVMGSVDKSKHNWQIFINGTILHYDSLLQKLRDPNLFPDIEVVDISLCDESLKSNWPEYMSDEEVAALAHQYQRAGKMSIFAREYMNKPAADEDQNFKAEYFKYLDHFEFKKRTKDRVVSTYVIADPAKTATAKAADSAAVVVSVCREEAIIYVADTYNEKVMPSDFMNAVIELASKWQVSGIAVESTGLNEYILQPWRNELSRRGIRTPLIEVKATVKKEDRVGALAPYYANGYIFHNKEKTTHLEHQLLEYPNAKYWDLMDALAHIISVANIQREEFFDVGWKGSPFDEDDFEYLEQTDYKDNPLSYAQSISNIENRYGPAYGEMFAGRRDYRPLNFGDDYEW